MRKEIVIRMHVKSEKYQTKAMKVAAAVSGVESVTLAGGDKSLLLVIGEGVDSNKLTKKLEKKVGAVEIVELRTLDSFKAAFPLGETMAAAALARSSPYNSSSSRQMRQYGYAASPSPYAYHYHPWPTMGGAAAGGYGYGAGGGASPYMRAVARSHPANYSPLVEKHDYHPMDHHTSTSSSSSSARRKSSNAVARRDSDTSSCVIL